MQDRNITFEMPGPDEQISSPVMIVTATTPAAVVEVWKHYHRHDDKPEDVLKMAEAIQAGRYQHENRATGTRAWYQVDVYLDKALEPYRRLLERLTGYDGPLPDMDMTDRFPNRLGHTHMTDTCGIEDGQFHARVYIQSKDWNGQPADHRADVDAEDYTQEAIGFRRFEREYITQQNGRIVHNPNYMKRHRAEPGIGAPWLWKALFEWWMENHATPEQRALLTRAAALRVEMRIGGEQDWEVRKGGGNEASVVSCGGVYVEDASGPIDWDGNGKRAAFVTWEQFRAAGQVEPAA